MTKAGQVTINQRIEIVHVYDLANDDHSMPKKSPKLIHLTCQIAANTVISFNLEPWNLNGTVFWAKEG